MAAFRTIMGAAFALSLLAANAAVASPLKTIMSITGSTEGYEPWSKLTELDGDFYGTTYHGGAHGVGSIFRIDPSAGSETSIYDFRDGNDGDINSAFTKAGDLLFGTNPVGGAYSAGTVFRLNPTTGRKEDIYTFSGGDDGHYPSAAMLYLDGMLYGITEWGGSAGNGTVFRVDPRSGRETVLYSFQGGSDGGNPVALNELDGDLYGATGTGGVSGAGTVFKLDRATGAFTVLTSVTTNIDGGSPAGFVGDAGKLYVTMSYGGAFDCGTILQVDPATGTASVLHSFDCKHDGSSPTGNMIPIGNKLYGTSWPGRSADAGNVFKIDKTTGALSLVHIFSGVPDDGAYPFSGLTKFGSALYGVTLSGGAYNGGTAFRIDLEGKMETVLHSFAGAPQETMGEGLVADKDKLLLTSGLGGAFKRGEVVRIDPATGSANVIDDFSLGLDPSNPETPLIKVDGSFFGTTVFGGAHKLGTVFKLNAVTGAQTIVHSFTSYNNSTAHSDGLDPSSGLTRAGKLLYGTTLAGGFYGWGTIYSLDPSTGAEVPVHAFSNRADSALPQGGLINVGGQLYGTTFGDTDANQYGTIFRFDPATNALTTVYVFAGNGEGEWPSASLLNVGGMLYGSTFYGGTSECGTIFRYDPATSKNTVLHSFDCDDGAQPFNPLFALNGQLYGTTYYGGTDHYGVVFRMDRFTGTEHVLHNFKNAADGGGPASNLIFLNGLLYGATSTGGAAGFGTVFSLEP